MTAHRLPSWDAMVHHAIDELENARRKMSEARDWLNSDWDRSGGSPSDAAVDVRRRVMAMIGAIKGQIDEAKGLLWDATTDP